jgi:hypothetical protein
MEILEVSAKEFTEILSSPYYIFGSASFNELNKVNCDEVFYLLFREGKYRLGLIGGVRDNVYYSPFSAPFGGFTFVSDDVRLQYLDDAIKLLKSWALEKKLASITIKLPPAVYESSFIPKQINSLWRHGFSISDIDLNYSFDLADFDDAYPEKIKYNAKKNLRISINIGLTFNLCANEEEKIEAYDIIRKNRESRGYPLRMSLEQVLDTIRIIPADFFVVQDRSGEKIASSLVFHVSSEIVQVIYWGDLPGYSETKPMNFISYKVFEYYKAAGKKIVDIGPSTENSVPNFGLIEFKESIGCLTSTKVTFKVSF